MKIFMFFRQSEVDQTTGEIEMRKTRLRLKNYVHFYEHFFFLFFFFCYLCFCFGLF